MSGESLCIRTFGEIIRKRMNKKAQIKNFDADRNTFQSDVEVKQNKEMNLSQIFYFYKLLLDSIIYIATGSGEEDLPDIDATMTSQLKNGEWEIHQKIQAIAQRPRMKEVVSAYFEVNLIPNIPLTVLSNVLGDIDALVHHSADINARKRNALKQAYQQKKSDAQYLADIWLFAICNGTNKNDATRSDTSPGIRTLKGKDSFEVLKEIDDLLAKIPAPSQVQMPVLLTTEEQPYISELYAAYGDKEGVSDFCEAHLHQFEEYNEDINDRRIDYFAAESIRRGVSELYSGMYVNQFDVLKAETLSGVKDTARRAYPNGYERMLNVMEQAARIEVQQYILSSSPNWISNRIKKGVCHFLVGDNKLKWVRR